MRGTKVYWKYKWPAESIPYRIPSKKKERLDMNASLGKHLQFLAQMASASSVVRKMHAEYTRHLINVEYLLKQFSKDKKGSDK